MVVEKGRLISAVAKDLGVSQPALRRWIKASTEPDNSPAKRLAELEAENRKLKKDLKDANDNIKNPNTVWVGDITYNWTGEGWLYTAIVKDLCTKEVVGYAMGDRITKELVIKAMKTSIKRERPKAAGLIFHSDRGVQYCSNGFKDLLKANRINQSMSRKGNPYDNACAENFFSC